MEADLPNLRRGPPRTVVEDCLRRGRSRFGCRVVHYCVQSNHLHLLVEARDKEALGRGMKGLQVRIARRLNGLHGRRGRVFTHRYHARILRTPREVRNALAYVLNNARRHQKRERPADWIDPLSSGGEFDGWSGRAPTRAACFARPHSWLLDRGWRRHGLIRIDEVPG